MLPFSIIQRILDFAFPRLRRSAYINFYGGEPLLCYPTIQETVRYIERQSSGLGEIIYTMTTNASLLDDEKLAFFNRHGFFLFVSFDGYAQEQTRIGGSYSQIISLLRRRFRFPDISWTVNSVFTPATVSTLADSIGILLDLELPSILVLPDRKQSWNKAALGEFQNQMNHLKKKVLKKGNKAGFIPVVNFSYPPLETHAPYICGAGKKGLFFTTDGRVWGCAVSASAARNLPQLQKYSLGSFEEFFRDPVGMRSKGMRRYRRLRLDRCRTDTGKCSECPQLPFCRHCPLEAAGVSQELGVIPSWFCEIGRISKATAGDFWVEWKKKNSG